METMKQKSQTRNKRSRKRPLSESLPSSAAEPSKICNVVSTTIPWRNTEQLYVHPLTLSCARTGGCLVCAYKIACFDVALDKEFTAQWPNQRPETCPRLRTTSSLSLGDAATWPCFRSGKRFLTVGDGDFSYSVALARHLKYMSSSNNKNNSPLPSLTATSYESKATLQQVYRPQQLQSNFDELQQQRCQIRFQVDATQLPDDLQKTEWDVVVWNFPCTAVEKGQDGQNDRMEENKSLLRTFCRRIQAKEIHIAHKTKPPYDQWGLVELVTSVVRDDDGGEDDSKSWTFVGRIVLDRALWHPYVPRKALDQKSFPCHDACTYIFQRSKVKPWLDDSSSSMIRVTPRHLQELRNYWLARKQTLVSGTKSKQPNKKRRRR